MTSGPKEIRSDPAELIAYYHAAGMLCALCVIVIGAAMLCGWLFDVPALIRIPAEWDATYPSTALCMTTAGIALLAGARAFPGGRSKQLRMAAASAVCILAFMTLTQYLFNTNLGIDAFFRGW